MSICVNLTHVQTNAYANQSRRMYICDMCQLLNPVITP